MSPGAPEELPGGVLDDLRERAKELTCLYRVDEILADSGSALGELAPLLVAALPPGWKYPEICGARLVVGRFRCRGATFSDGPSALAAPIRSEGAVVGELTVSYSEERPDADEGPFLAGERQLLNAIAERVSFYLTRRSLWLAHSQLESAEAEALGRRGDDWSVILSFLRGTDPRLLHRITRRMINHLGLSGAPEAAPLLERFLSGADGTGLAAPDDNTPLRRTELRDLSQLSDETFSIAARRLGGEEIVLSIRSWIAEDKASFLSDALEDGSQALPSILDAVARFRTTVGDSSALPPPFRRMLGASLIRRLFTERPDLIAAARDLVSLEDAEDLVGRIVYPAGSHGLLGGKAAGLFVARKILEKAADREPALAEVRTPRTWYVTSDSLRAFVDYNDLHELYYRRYMDAEQVRREYPHIVQLLKGSHFPPELSRGLSLALEDLADRPIIVRSSSLLEDRDGAAFAGKYTSLFLANRGTRQERLAALEDAIAEVFASTFGPDPISYRAARGLLDVHEEMAIMIQEVVGTRVGPYFLPAWAGVAFSSNELRWSPRLRRESGLLRLVPGLGTRAVDRTSDDYPLLLSPGQPELRLHVTPEETLHYAPRQVDAIDLETGAFVTLNLRELLREYGAEYPRVRDLVSIVREDRIRPPIGLEPDFETDDLVVTFQGLLRGGELPETVAALLRVLSEALGHPVDLEIASDGESLYLLQCRAQSRSEGSAAARIPENLPSESTLFEASRDVSNGSVPELTHVVWVDPAAYAALPTEGDGHRRVARAIGRLNRVLPPRHFALIGPGRWGSRGDLRLGVPVSYADIANAALLVEIARPSSPRGPELSFGTHFFLDLVEADIRYLPLHPEEAGGRLDTDFLRNAASSLSELVPESGDLAAVLRVIDVPATTGERILRVAMNADENRAVGYFDLPSDEHVGAAPREDSSS